LAGRGGPRGSDTFGRDPIAAVAPTLFSIEGAISIVEALPSVARGVGLRHVGLSGREVSDLDQKGKR
jgi:hypothetical protein